MAVRPEFGPTLPALLAARGMSRRGMAVLAAAVVIVGLGGWFGLQAVRDREHLVVAGPPEFNLVYPPSAFHRVAPRGGELVRLEGGGRRVSAAITARAVRLPPYPGGDVVGGYLPILAERRIGELRGSYGPLQLFNEGKARINLFPGYQIGFGARRGAVRIFGRDTYLFPKETDVSDGVLLSLRRFVRRRPTAEDDVFLQAAKDAFNTFAFGESQP